MANIQLEDTAINLVLSALNLMRSRIYLRLQARILRDRHLVISCFSTFSIVFGFQLLNRVSSLLMSLANMVATTSAWLTTSSSTRSSSSEVKVAKEHSASLKFTNFSFLRDSQTSAEANGFLTMMPSLVILMSLNHLHEKALLLIRAELLRNTLRSIVPWRHQKTRLENSKN